MGIEDYLISPSYHLAQALGIRYYQSENPCKRDSAHGNVRITANNRCRQCKLIEDKARYRTSAYHLSAVAARESRAKKPRVKKPVRTPEEKLKRRAARQQNALTRSLTRMANAKAIGVPLLSRSAALVVGAEMYFTGKPCPAGHIAERYTQSTNCSACCKERIDSAFAYYLANMAKLYARLDNLDSVNPAFAARLRERYKDIL